MIDAEALLADLREGERANNKSGRCGTCVALTEVDPGPTRDALVAALAGTIGASKLSKILKSNGLDVAERQVRKHRDERHAS